MLPKQLHKWLFFSALYIFFFSFLDVFSQYTEIQLKTAHRSLAYIPESPFKVLS